MADSSRITRQFTVSFPPDLAEQIEQTAKIENRTLNELFREAFLAYEAQRLERILEQSQKRFAQNNTRNYEEADVLRLVEEARAERRSRPK